jgi:hypothetical protein
LKIKGYFQKAVLEIRWLERNEFNKNFMREIIYSGSRNYATNAEARTE